MNSLEEALQRIKDLEQALVEKTLSKSTGGSNRNWTTRYNEMKLKYQILKKMDANPEFIKGYELCMETFESKPITVTTTSKLEKVIAESSKKTVQETTPLTSTTLPVPSAL